VPRVALTFDDGPGPITSDLLTLLARERWPATFFVLGRNVVEAPWNGDPAAARALVVRALREGHVVGNHTYGHGRPETWRDLAGEVTRVDALIREWRAEAGVAVDAPVAVRLPYGPRLVERSFEADDGFLDAIVLDPRLAVLASLGRTHVHWTLSIADWEPAREDGPALAGRMIAHVEAQARLGLDAVIDLHDSGTGSGHGYARPATLDAVGRLIAHARAQGWTPFTVPV
jgi:peptidoglycan/xylan/chitin deacetylase (PgdA/CDA1 family)